MQDLHRVDHDCFKEHQLLCISVINWNKKKKVKNEKTKAEFARKRTAFAERTTVKKKQKGK